MADNVASNAPFEPDTDPGRYRHWHVSYDGAIARVLMDVKEDLGLRPGYVLKLNSYDLGVDRELADIVERLRFEHPEVRSVVLSSARDRIFCAGANIHMLATSSHAFKVNFCKYTNETRLGIEEASQESGIRFLCAVNGPCAGGGYELALACDEIYLMDDGSSTVGLPEVPLLGVLPGTGGLTRVVDKRKVRRDRADVFSTLSEGIRGKRAVEWGLVDQLVPRSRFDEAVARRAAELAARPDAPGRTGPGIPLVGIAPEIGLDSWTYPHVKVKLDRVGRTAEITVAAPDPSAPAPASHEDLLRAGAHLWALAAFRALDDAILRLRFNEPELGLFLIRTTGSPDAVLRHDRALVDLVKGGSWLGKEIVLKMRRTLKRLELSARTSFAIAGAGSCFAGSLYELALAADRIYMLDAPGVAIQLSPMNFGPLPMSNGLTRLQTRFWGFPQKLAAAEGALDDGPLDAATALDLGLCTMTPDEIDWDDEVRVAVEERVALSPDALTGMEASLRYPGPETLETKIFGRLSAWQNWIFQRPNAVGDRGALSLYGRPERPVFDRRRT